MVNLLWYCVKSGNLQIFILGGNPSGASTTVERKMKIYKIAQKYKAIPINTKEEGRENDH